MMQSSYKMICSLGVFHTYFENDICTCLHFKPDAVTSSLFRRFGFKIKNEINGFELFLDTTGSVAAVFDYMSKVSRQDYFEFNISSDNKAFQLFTELPSDQLGQLVFDSSSASNQYQGETMLLTGNIIPMPVASGAGTLKIYFADILKTPEAAFEIRLNARTTQWQYYIVNKSAVQLDNPSISGKQDVRFDGPENVTIPSGQQAMLFSSGTTLLPLSEIPKYKFDLVDISAAGNTAAKKISAGKTIFKGLPNPDPGNTGVIMLNGKKQSASPIYVYV